MYSRQENKQQRLTLRHSGTSLTGKREQNQDAMLVKQPESANELIHKGIVACIADGVSCSAQSQKASHTAVVQFITDYFSTPDSWSVKHSASQILTSLNAWLYEEGVKQGSLADHGLVTTFSAVVFKSNTAHIFHVGDSRVYRIRANKLALLTKDHQRINFGKGAYLTRALGMDNVLEVDYQTAVLEEGDRFLLSTDGVHDYLSEGELAKVLQTGSSVSLQNLTDNLCAQALQNGSEDNLSSVLVEVTGLPNQSVLEHQNKVLSRALPPALKEGNTLDQYRVDKVLYEGTRSHVYLVYDVNTNQQLVLKAPSQQLAEDREQLIHFANESWVGSQLNSERVMKVYAGPKQSYFAYLLCEWVEGITLRQWMYDNPNPSLEKVRELLNELVKAARVFQRAGMVHQDLKPENIMITPEGKLKVIDFGAVKSEGLEEITGNVRDKIPLGALHYIAPEYIQNSDTTTQSDLFSIAVIGYEMLTGEMPYKQVRGQDITQARHIKWDYRSIHSHRRDLPDWIDWTFKKATHFNPKQRYIAMSEFITDLYTPNRTLQSEFQQSPILTRNPVLFWKVLAQVAIVIALVELIFLL